MIGTMAKMPISRARKGAAPRASRKPGSSVENPIDLRHTVAFRVLGIAGKLTNGFLQIYTARFGIGLPEWRTLGMLGQFGPIPSIRIADLADMDRGSISRVVAWLEAKKLVRRMDDPAHKRRQIVVLTAAGKRLHDRISAYAHLRQRRILALLSPAERSALDGIFQKLDQWADELRAGAVPPQPASTPGAARRPRSESNLRATSQVTLNREKLLAELTQFKRVLENCA